MDTLLQSDDVPVRDYRVFFLLPVLTYLYGSWSFTPLTLHGCYTPYTGTCDSVCYSSPVPFAALARHQSSFSEKSVVTGTLLPSGRWESRKKKFEIRAEFGDAHRSLWSVDARQSL